MEYIVFYYIWNYIRLLIYFSVLTINAVGLALCIAVVWVLVVAAKKVYTMFNSTKD